MLHFKRLLVHTSAYVEPSKRDLRPYFWARPFFLDRLPTHLSTSFFLPMRMFALCPSISALGYCLSMAKSRKTQPAFPGRLLFCQQLPTLSYSTTKAFMQCCFSRFFSTELFFVSSFRTTFLWPKFNRFTEYRAVASSSLRLLLSGTFNKKRGHKKLI